MTDQGIVLRKLIWLREQVTRLRRRRPDCIDDVRDNTDLQDAIGMSLLVAVQEALDVAAHVAADSGWGVPASYAESFELLANHGVIDAETKARLIGMATLRNRLAHGYASVDFECVWAELPDGIEAFERFASAIAQRMEG